MWCKQCRQEVPGIASLDEGAFHCARCGACVGRRKIALAESSLADGICDQGIDLLGESTNSCSSEVLDPWAEDEHVENVRRLLRPVSAGGERTRSRQSEDDSRLRFDPPASHFLRVPFPQTPPNPPIYSPPTPWPVAPRPEVITQPAAGQSMLGSLASCVASFGLMGLVCGGVLLGWSLATERTELWTLGLPIAIVGHSILFIGLLLTYAAKSSMRPKARRAKAAQAPHDGSGLDTNMASTPAMLAELRGQIERLSAQVSANSSPFHRSW